MKAMIVIVISGGVGFIIYWTFATGAKQEELLMFDELYPWLYIMLMFNTIQITKLIY